MDKKLYKMMDWARIEQIVYSEEDDPQSFLGAHEIPEGLIIQAFFPGAKKCEAIVSVNGDTKTYNMDCMDDEGFFACLLKNTSLAGLSYKYKVHYKNRTVMAHDPYMFKSVFRSAVLKSFEEGWCYDIYEYLGAH